MIIKFDQFLNESLKDKLKGKSEDEMKDNILKLIVFDRISKIKNYNLSDNLMPSDEEIQDELNEFSIKEQYKLIKKYDLSEKFYPTSKEELLHTLSNMEMWKKLVAIQDNYIPIEIYKDDKELVDYLDQSILGKIMEIRTSTKEITDKYILDEVNGSTYEDGLDQSLYDIQELIDQPYGDNAGMYFSKFDDADEHWERLAPIDRKILINDYLDSEHRDVD